MEHEPNDYDEPETLAAWLEEQKGFVAEYLSREGVSHGRVADCIPDEPDFCVAPYLAVWRIMADACGNQVRWWVICGDLPTDYVSAAEVHDAREVLAHFSKCWSEVAECMKAGKAHPSITIGPSEEWPKLAPLLKSRAEILRQFADDDTVWDDDDMLLGEDK